MSEQSVDIHNINPPTIVEKASKSKGLEHIPDDVKQILFLNWLVDARELYQEQENKVKQILINKTLQKAISEWHYAWWIEVKYIGEGLYMVKSIKKWNVTFYSNDNWESVFSVSWVREDPFIENNKALEDLWYIEKKEGETYNMYKISWYITLADWKKEPVPWEKINTDDIRYYKLWKDILFRADIYSKLFILKDKKPIEGKMLIYLIEGWSLKLEDLELFKQNNVIDDNMYLTWIRAFKQVIAFQCSDKRLIGLWIWIKESDLKRYTENTKYNISPELALECFKALPAEMRDISSPKK
ncbi:MAG: hypothetical protein ACD_3C00049G0011 [uncultured bacterium (gcode 4)]|uniref:Uncharacterized protein n=1 Tax=uncultured bacterium (gcode 4) TaxID=1234023 RepID=K2GE60_9BACT|nr:MAG: hypothetical protein ACD_3C00049G0011 [uncultured bacterium (gcode 4)]